jgi:hypothetical protein
MWWHTAVILTPLEVEIGRSWFETSEQKFKNLPKK